MKTWTTEMKIKKKTLLAFSNGICCLYENNYGHQQRTCWYNDKKNGLLNYSIIKLDDQIHKRAKLVVVISMQTHGQLKQQNIPYW